MTLPAYSATGTLSETAPAWPTHSAGDYGLLFVETASTTLTTPSGWTLIRQVDHGLTSLAVFERFATSNSESAPSLAGGTNHKSGYIVTFTGVNTASPRHGIASIAAASTTSQALPGTRPFLDDCLIVLAGSWSTDDAGPEVSGSPSNSVLGSLTV